MWRRGWIVGISISSLLKLSFCEISSEVGGGRGVQAQTLQRNTALMSWRNNLNDSMSASRHIRGNNYVQLATTDVCGAPSCRTVVFRGFLPNSDNFRVITDIRSDKIKSLELNSAFEMVWWFPSPRLEQYRIAGTAEIIRANETRTDLLQKRVEMWNELTNAAKLQFYWDKGGDPFTEHMSNPAVENLEAPHPSYVLLIMSPTKVTYLRLTDNYAQRDILAIESEKSCVNDRKWISTRINP
jgi:pyridoxamine 5'-phosphate oxidase